MPECSPSHDSKRRDEESLYSNYTFTTLIDRFTGIIVSLGLVQNLAAIKALTSTGIQAGHMKLQAKSLALLAGANPEEMPHVLSELLKAKHMNQETAQAILEKLRNP